MGLQGRVPCVLSWTLSLAGRFGTGPWRGGVWAKILLLALQLQLCNGTAPPELQGCPQYVRYPQPRNPHAALTHSRQLGREAAGGCRVRAHVDQVSGRLGLAWGLGAGERPPSSSQPDLQPHSLLS